MDAAVTALTPANEAALLAAATPATPQGPIARLQALPARSKLMLGLGSAGLAALLVVMALWSRQVPMAPLFPTLLPDAELGLVLDQLRKLGETPEIGRQGGLIMVPAEHVAELRAKLAALGLPKAQPTGYEAAEKTPFGQSQQQERTAKERLLGSLVESSLTRMSAVQSVKVIVALPQQSGFYLDQGKPTASVMLTLHPGRTLDREQIASIVNTTANAVRMSPKDVSVTDQDGNWLSQPQTDGALRGDLSAQQRAHQREREAALLDKVKKILEPALGADNLRATVTAELDFNQIESTSETYAPNQGADARATVRSQRSLESSATAPPQPAGVPGAVSNQPSAPTTTTSAPAQGTQASTSAAGGGAGLRRETQVNYEADKTVAVRRNAVGEIRRVNVAVMVNHRSAVDAKTGKTLSTPLSDEEMKKLTELVQEAVGYNKDRGDSVRVVNIPFRSEPKVEPEALPIWRDPGLLDLLRVAGMPAALTAVALMLLLGVVRPALRPPKPPLPEATLDARVDDAEPLPGPATPDPLALEAPKAENRLTEARTMARDNPQAVANILRNWIDGE
ncbi:MAG: flagellar M-ring protein FliF [Burkholderiaceae bacterium]|nr:flagellar M-ring protein FliF [Burkholderiaceae bacterium]